VRRLACALGDLGVRRGHRVGWLGANHPAFLETLFATTKLGAILAPVNHRLDEAVIHDVLRELAPTVVVVAPPALDASLPRVVRWRVVVDADSGSDVDYEQLIATARDNPVDEVVGTDDLCMITHTSGTTGLPKGVMLTHANITWNVVNLLSVADFRGDDVTVAVAPFFRTGGTGVNVLPVLFKGGAVVVPEAGDPDEILGLLERWQVTVGFGNPDLLEMITRSPRWNDADLSAVRMFITGGAPVPEHLIRTYMERGVTFLQGYGLSEAAPVVLLLDPQSASRKIGSAGKPPLFVDVRTIRPDGTPCEPGETGELLVSGPNVMTGYWNRPVETREALDEHGWLHTGDAARIDDEGFVWIVDRVADAFDASGHVVHPGDVERVLARHPAVADACVAPVDGESTAFVVLASGVDVTEHELIEFARSQLESHAVPRSITFVDRLPRSSVGKLLRHELVTQVRARRSSADR
jgi:fatty-acyl-CoA synthase